MHNFNEKHLQVIESVGCRYKICEGSILKYQKRQDVDAFVYDRQAEKYLQVQWKASCRYGGPKKSICNSEYLGSADTSVVNRASATANIKLVQIHQLPQRHLYKQITSWYRYIRHQKSKSIIAPPISITIHHKARKDYAIQRIGVGFARRSWAGVHSLFLAWGCRELNSNFMNQIHFNILTKPPLKAIV